MICKKPIIIIKKFTAAIFIVLAVSAKADFDLGMQYYEDGLYKKAYREFLHAARYGDHLAQQNIGAMYYRGEFVVQDAITSYGWFALAAQGEGYKEKAIHAKLYEKFSEDDKQKAEEIYAELFKEYSNEAIENRLLPNFVGVSVSSKKIRALKKVHPKYPKSMLRRGKMVG